MPASMRRSTKSSTTSTTRCWPRRMVVRFELQLLSELGFGLDLERCAATGVSGDLVYVSPKSGRAVSREPPASRGPTRCCGCRRSCANAMLRPSADDLADGFALTGFFLSAMCSSRAACTRRRARAFHRCAKPCAAERSLNSPPVAPSIIRTAVVIGTAVIVRSGSPDAAPATAIRAAAPNLASKARPGPDWCH